MATLAEIRAKLQAQENKSSGNNSGNFGDGAIYPHWNIDEGTTAVVRFLPDGEASNPFFWIEKAMIKLPFNGVKGVDQKQVMVQVPCMEMWGETCPILTEVRPWFKDPSLEEMGRKYWKKKSYIFQGFVREDPLNEQNAPENLIRRFILGPSLFRIVKAALLDPELENLPTDYDTGLDFKITKEQKGGFANYDTSTWARKETALREKELAAIETFGLGNLKDYLPKKPSAIELGVMVEMFEASVDGKPFDLERWGQYFRPFGYDAPGTSTSTTEGASEPAAKAAPAKAEASAPWEADAKEAADVLDKAAESKAPAGGDKAAEILAMIRSRQAKTA